jgi:hypothetical protein
VPGAKDMAVSIAQMILQSRTPTVCFSGAPIQ